MTPPGGMIDKRRERISLVERRYRGSTRLFSRVCAIVSRCLRAISFPPPPPPPGNPARVVAQVLINKVLPSSCGSEMRDSFLLVLSFSSSRLPPSSPVSLCLSLCLTYAWGRPTSGGCTLINGNLTARTTGRPYTPTTAAANEKRSGRLPGMKCEDEDRNATAAERKSKPRADAVIKGK